MLKNLVVAISGGAGRIGTAFSRAVVENNGKIIIGDVAENEGQNLVLELGEENAQFVKCDVTDPTEISHFIESGLKKFNQIDAAVHCSYPRSSQWGTRFEDLKPIELKEDLFNQIGSAILFSQAFIRYFKKNGHGNLIHLSSIQGISAPKFEHYSGTNMVSPIEYSAIKSAIISITRYLAKYLKGSNIRVNCISPGGILDDQPESFLKKYKASCQTKGMLDAEDIAGALIFLLSENSKHINGQNIIVDDGWTL
jgi:NAD(P)-dependent dehydrogenase (short-subunit alcohol dehydrogenase family)